MKGIGFEEGTDPSEIGKESETKGGKALYWILEGARLFLLAIICLAVIKCMNVFYKGVGDNGTQKQILERGSKTSRK